MSDLNSKSNNDILLEIKQLEIDHQITKDKMLKFYDEMVEIEKRYDEANRLFIKRLKGEQNG